MKCTHATTAILRLPSRFCERDCGANGFAQEVRTQAAEQMPIFAITMFPCISFSIDYNISKVKQEYVCNQKVGHRLSIYKGYHFKPAGTPRLIYPPLSSTPPTEQVQKALTGLTPHTNSHTKHRPAGLRNQNARLGQPAFQRSALSKETQFPFGSAERVDSSVVGRNPPAARRARAGSRSIGISQTEGKREEEERETLSFPLSLSHRRPASACTYVRHPRTSRERDSGFRFSFLLITPAACTCVCVSAASEREGKEAVRR